MCVCVCVSVRLREREKELWECAWGRSVRRLGEHVVHNEGIVDTKHNVTSSSGECIRGVKDIVVRAVISTPSQRLNDFILGDGTTNGASPRACRDECSWKELVPCLYDRTSCMSTVLVTTSTSLRLNCEACEMKQ